MSQAYDLLGFVDPMEYEQSVYSESPFREAMDRMNIGSTTHMAVEACLDIRNLGLSKVEIWYAKSDTKAHDAIWHVLKKLLSGGEVTTCAMDQMEEIPEYPVYLDHHLIHPTERITGPDRLVRTVSRHLLDFRLYTRDGYFVATTNQEGVDRLQAFGSCRLILPTNVPYIPKSVRDPGAEGSA